MAVTLENIAVELGRATPTADSIEGKQWQSWIDRATSIIHKRAEKLGVPVADLDAEVVDYVVTLAVAAHVRQPDNSTQVDIAIDDGRVSKRYETSTGRVSILDEWWEDLGLIDDSGAFTVTPTFVPDNAWPLP